MDISTIRNRGYSPAVEFVQKTFGSYLNPAYDETDRGDLTDVVVGNIVYSAIRSIVGDSLHFHLNAVNKN